MRPQLPAASGKGLIGSQPSWVEVRDRSGQIIFPSSTRRAVRGKSTDSRRFPWLSATPRTSVIRYRGREITQPRSRDDVARVTWWK